MKRGKREVKRTGLGRRFLSVFLAVVMCTSMLQLSVFAADPTDAEKTEQAQEQILGGTTPKYYTWDAEANAFGEGTVTNPVVKNHNTDTKVTLSKTIAPTGVENEFDITLQVVTDEAIETTITSPDAAVVLVLDTSSSMAACAECGNGAGGFNSNHTYGCSHSGSIQESETRLAAAKTAAKDFLRTYAGFTTENDTTTFTAPGAARKVAIVAYNSSASTVLNWTDVAATTAEGADSILDTIDSKIDNLTRATGTNTDAGLKSAQTLLANSAVSGIGNKFLVLMTDGEPRANTGETLSYGYPNGYTQRTGNGSTNYNNPAQRANYIRTNLNTTFYSISLSAGDSVSGWLDSISNKCVTADNSDELYLAFEEIVNRMKLVVDAWQVTDPMGQYMSLVGVKDLQKHGNNALSTTAAGNTLTWDLRADLASESTVIKDESGNTIAAANYQPGMDCTITYTLDYTVKLDVNAIINDALASVEEGGDADAAVRAALNEYYLTNGKTQLDYYLTSTNDSTNETIFVDDAGNELGDGEDKMLTQYFKVPAVKGYAAKLAFTKVGPKGEELQGAQFSLTNAANTWSAAATSDKDGNVVFTKWIPSGDTYTLTETAAPAGYEKVAPVDFAVAYGEYPSDFKLNNRELVDPAKVVRTDVTITKTWRSPNGVTPESITVTLKQNGSAMADYTNYVINKSDCTVDTLTGVWSYTFEDMIALDAEGNTYTYTVEEVVPNGYKVDGQDTLDLINTATGKVNVIVTKEWLLPDTMNTTSALVDVILYANGVEVDREENVNDGRTVSFMNLEQYDENGQAILYTVGEESDAAYQQVAIDKVAEAGPTTMYTIVNTVAEEYDATVSGTKIWKDDNDVANRKDITVALYADGEAVVDGEGNAVTAVATADTNWQYNFTGLQRYNFIRSEAGRIIGVQEIVYTVKEVGEVAGYESSAVGTDVINTRVGTVNFTVTKEWAADLSGAEHGAVSAILYANGHPVAESDSFVDSYTFEGLDKYDADGVAIVYDVIEVPVDGYTASYSDVTIDENGYAQTITNTRDDADDTLTITVTKAWKQPGDVEAQTATFQLFKGTEETTKFLQITGNGVGYFENLPRYEEVTVVISENEETGEKVTETELVEIDYNVKEIDIPRNYINTVAEELEADSYGNFTCNFVNTITGTTDIFVEKSWVKPTSITAPEITVSVQVYDLDQGEWVALNDGIVIESGESNGSMKNLPAYDADGRRMSYRVTELSVSGYSSAVNGGYNSETGDYEYSIVNSINPSNSEITVSKQWLDGNTPAAERPSVTLQLLRDGQEYDTVEFWYDASAEKVMATTKYNTVDAIVSEDGNTYSVKLTVSDYSADLTMKHAYSVAEWNKPAGYTGVVDGYTATNTRVGTIDIDVTKYWTDPGDVARPDITLTLTGMVGDEIVETYDILVSDDTGAVVATMNGVELAVDANGNTWTITAAGLNQYENGAKITYTLSEAPVEGYEAEVVEDQPFAINNVIVDPCDVTVSAEKQWVMDESGYFKPEYPESITVALFRDGVKVEGSEQTVTQESGYAIESYTDLEKYAPNGARYSYQILELNKDGAAVTGQESNNTISFGENNDYTVTYTENEDGIPTITNTFIVPAKYLWYVTTNYVHKDHDGTILLDWGTQTEIYAEIESQTITVDPAAYAICPQDGLTYELDTSKTNITSVELVRENHVYELVLNYILIEEAPPAPPVPPAPPSSDDTYLNVKKVWVGDDEEMRPESIEVQLLRNGEAYGEVVTLSEDNNWKTSWTSLDDNYDWSVEEVNVPEGYTADVTNKGTSWTITNTLDVVEIPEEDVPQVEIPDEDVPLVEIPEEEVPLVDVPKTGDASALWLMMSVLSGTGLAGVTFLGRKKKEEE